MHTKVSHFYDPAEYRLRSFHDGVSGFIDGTTTPRDYLEACLAVIESREPVVKAFVAMNLPGARAAADASTLRYRAGKVLSPVDGMPVTFQLGPKCQGVGKLSAPRAVAVLPGEYRDAAQAPTMEDVELLADRRLVGCLAAEVVVETPHSAHETFAVTLAGYVEGSEGLDPGRDG